MIKILYKTNTNTKLLAYTNETVKTHNKNIRKKLGYTEPYIIGEGLMAYTSIGYPELILENSAEYKIINIIKTTTHRVENEYTDLCGYLIDLQLLETLEKVVIKGLFFIDINDESNYYLIREIIDRGNKVNSNSSTPKDYQHYKKLKDKVIFMEDIYIFEREIYSEASFREQNPLLFTNLRELINYETKIPTKISSKLSIKIDGMYGDVINNRIADNKLYSNSEILADRFKVIEADIKHSYSITTHRSQGSGFSGIVVDEPDFGKIRDKWNYKYNKLENNLLERNQLRYVAYSRAKENLFVISDDI